MKHIVLAVAFVSVMLYAVVAFGQTPPPPPTPYDPYSLSNFGVRSQARCAWYEFWCSDSVYKNPNVSPNTKRKLYEHDPSVCHCAECRRARLAAGIEYMGLDPVYPPRRRVVPPPPVSTPYQPPRPLSETFRAWCASTNSFIPRYQCPDKK